MFSRCINDLGFFGRNLAQYFTEKVFIPKGEQFRQSREDKVGDMLLIPLRVYLDIPWYVCMVYRCPEYYKKK